MRDISDQISGIRRENEKLSVIGFQFSVRKEEDTTPASPVWTPAPETQGFGEKSRIGGR